MQTNHPPAEIAFGSTVHRGDNGPAASPCWCWWPFHVSSINTSRAGSNMNRSRRHRRRARATSGRCCSAARRLFFLKVRSCRAKDRQTAVRLPGMRRLRIAATISSSVKSSCSATTASSHFACSSNGDVLPRLGFALALPVSRQRCNHFTAELGLRLKLSAASRRDAPASIASITRSRKSSEYGFGIARVPQKNRCCQTRPSTALGNPYGSTQPKLALALESLTAGNMVRMSQVL
jgi:hypothetical protein